MSDERGLLRLRTHHVAGGVAEAQDGDVEGVADLHHARRLVRAVAVDRAREVDRVVGDEADRPSLDADEGAHHAGSELALELEDRPFVREHLDDPSHVVDPEPILGNRVPKAPLVGARPDVHPALEVREVPFRGDHRLRLVLDRDVHDPVRDLDVHRPHLLGPEDAEPPALDHRGPPHADIGVPGRDHHVAAAEHHRVAGEAPPGGDADERHESAQPPEEMEGGDVQVRREDDVGVAGPPSPALGEEHHREAPLLGEGEHAVLLLVVELPLGAGEDGVVVGHHEAARPLVAEEAPVDAADPGHEPVRGGAAHQLVHGVALAPGRDHKGAVLDEGALVHKVVHVLAGRPLPGAPAALDRVRAPVVAGEGLALQHFPEVRTDRVEVEIFAFAGVRRRHLGLVKHEEWAPLRDRVALADHEAPNPAASLRRDHVLHLHRLHDEQLATEVDGVALDDEHLDHCALHRGEDRARLRHPRHGSGRGVPPGRHPGTARLAVLPVREHRERVRGVHLRPGKHRGRGRGPIGGRRGDAGRGLRLRTITVHEGRKVRLHEPGMEASGHDLGMREEVPEEGDVGRDPGEPELPERPPQLGRSCRKGVRPGRAVAPHHDLGDEGIEARVRGVSRVAARVHAHPGAGRRLEPVDDAARRAHRPVRLKGLEVHPRLHREAPAGDAVSFPGERPAPREFELEPHEVDPRELLGHRVLDLDPRIGLDEVRAARLVHQELERPEVREPGLPREREGGGDDPLAEARIEVRGGRDLDDLLAPPLEAALALAEIDDRARPVAGHLDLDVPGPLDEAFDVEIVTAEGAPGLVAAARPLAFERRGVTDGGHPAAASAPRRLDHHPAPVLSEGEQELAGSLQPALDRGPRKNPHPAALRERPCPGLVPEELEGLRSRSDECDAAFRASPGEVRVLAQEPVPGVDGVAVRALRRAEDRRLVEVGGGAPPRKRLHLVRPRRVEGPRVVLGAHRHRGEAELRRAPRDADRDLPPIGDEDAPESHVPPCPSAGPNLRSSTHRRTRSNLPETGVVSRSDFRPVQVDSERTRDLNRSSSMPRFEIQCSRESFTDDEIGILERYGRQFTALACGRRPPKTEAQRRFVECANKKRSPETICEKTWAKYVSRTKWERRQRPQSQPEKDDLRRVYDDREDWKRMRGTVWGEMMQRVRGHDA